MTITSDAVGIDIGNGKCVIALAKNGVVDALVNEASARETPSVVQFAADHRLFGATALSNLTSNTTSTISQLKRLVGRPFNDNSFQEDRRRLPYETSSTPEGMISIKVRYLNEDRMFTAREMLAMLLSHLRRTAELTTGSDCVIGVPNHFSDRQENDYWCAAKIAGWNPIGLLHEGTATALEYSNSRDRCVGEAVVVFFDVGHSDTQATVVQFEGKKGLRVLGKASDPNLGGRDFDELIFDYFTTMFKNKYEIDVCSDVKASVRVRLLCEKAKRVLSANKEAHVSVEGLMGGVDADGVISRERFEEMSSHLVERVRAVWREALSKAGVEVGRVHSVELVGSGSRIPAISRALRELFGRDLNRTLNGSECVARGCALRCEKLLRQMASGQRPPEQTVHTRFRSGKTLTEAREEEEKLARQDRIVERAQERRNYLESLIYKLHAKHLESTMIADESEMDRISRALREMENWLLEEGDKNPEMVYEEKIKELTLLTSTIKNHDNEAVQVQASAEIQSHTDVVSSQSNDRKPIRSDQTLPRSTDMLYGDQIKASQTKLITTTSGNSSSRGEKKPGSSGQNIDISATDHRQIAPAKSVIPRKSANGRRRKNSRRKTLAKLCDVCNPCKQTDVESPSPIVRYKKKDK